MKNLDTIAEELFNKIRGRFQSVTIGNENGEVTNVPKEARFYDFDYSEGDKSLGKVSVSLTDDSVAVMYTNDFVTNEDSLTKDNWYNFLKELRTFAKKRLLNFDTRDINKTNLDKRDYKFLATNRPGDITMESKMYGTNKTSYQNIGNAKLTIKHSKPINLESATGRIQNVKAIYIENSEGERFKYPAKHLNGARAMARHVSEGGKPYDDFGKHITGLSEELANLKKFKAYVNRSGVMAEGLGGYLDVVNERMTQVKKSIQSLQKESTYKQAFESFEITEFKEVPDDVAENWIDQLTIKQFNEDLKDVFPYIYRLVSEATKAKELGPEDFLGEANEEDFIYTVRQGDTVYGIAQRLGIAVDDIVEINGLNDPRQIRVGQQLRLPGDPDAENIGAGGTREIGPNGEPTGSTRGVSPLPQNIGAGGTRERGPNGQMTGSTRGINPGESFEEHMNSVMGQFGETNQYEITPHQRKMAMLGHKMRHSFEPGSGVDWDDRDFNLAAELSTQLIQLGTNFGPKTIAAALKNVGENGIDVEEASRLIKHAMGQDEEEANEGRKRDVDGDGDVDSDDYMAAKDVAIKKAMRQQDGEEVEEQQTPLGEFILSYFDRQSGQFPKGETAVLTMVEKQYGENFINPAKQFIEMVNNKVAEVMGYKDPEIEEDNIIGNPSSVQRLAPLSDAEQEEMLRGYLGWLQTLGPDLFAEAQRIIKNSTSVVPGAGPNVHTGFRALRQDRNHARLIQNYLDRKKQGTLDTISPYTGDLFDSIQDVEEGESQEYNDIMRLAGL